MSSAKVEKAAAAAMGTEAEDGRPYGHLGTLTKEQEVCLRRMWDGLLAFFADDQKRIQELGVGDAFSEVSLKRESEPPAETADAAPAKDDAASKKKGGFWGGLSNGITAVTSMAGLKAADSEEEDVMCSSKRPVTLEEMQHEFWNLIMHDHPDSLLLRFLRARKWDVTKALGVAVSTLQWRIREDVAGIIRDGESMINTRPLMLGQSYFHSTDRQSRPVCYINVKYHNKDLQPFNDVRRFTIWVMETARLMIHAPVETADILFDLDGFTLSNMDNQFVKFIVQCFQAYYPESLGIYMVSSAPFVFWSIWKMVEMWLDPVVAAKFHCARDLTDLQKFIPPENLPPRLKGTSSYVYYYPPPREEDDVRIQDEEGRAVRRAELTALSDRFVAATRRWISETNEEGEGGAEAVKERDATAAEMSVAYFKLDPYIRSRTIYHRLEVLGEDGSCDWSRLLTQEQYEAKQAGKSTTEKAVEAEVSEDVVAAAAAADASVAATEIIVTATVTETVLAEDGVQVAETIITTTQICTSDAVDDTAAAGDSEPAAKDAAE